MARIGGRFVPRTAVLLSRGRTRRPERGSPWSRGQRRIASLATLDSRTGGIGRSQVASRLRPA